MARPVPQPADQPVSAQDLIDDLDTHTGQMARDRYATLHPNRGWEMAFKLADLILDEAVRRDWCGEYEDWAAAVNRELGFILVPSRRITYSVSMSIEVPRGTLLPDITRAIEEIVASRFDGEANPLDGRLVPS